MSPDPNHERIKLTGLLERAIFEADDRSYVVAELVARDRSRHVVAGSLGGCGIGDFVEVEGEPIVHPRFGAQLKIWTLRWIPPASEEGMRRLLGSGSIGGVGEGYAKRIVARFGKETARVLDEQPERLHEIAGLGEKRIAAIQDAWKEKRAQNAEVAFLAGLGLGPGMVERVRAALGENVAQLVRANPWELARAVEGIGFRRADEIAQKLEFPADSPERVVAGVEAALQESADEGHVHVPRTALVEAACRLLSLPAGPIEDAIAKSLERGRIESDPLGGKEGGELALSLPWLRRAEVEGAEQFTARIGEVDAKKSIDAERALAWAAPRLGITLTKDQHAALGLLFNQGVGVLTGGPGVGKTTIIRALVEVFAKRELNVLLAAPTGRAARRLAEACGRPAATIHRLLKFDPRRRRFTHDGDFPLEVDVLIVDEASMIDLPLMRDLLRALPAGARFLVVGDADQLPSVGPGDVLRSLVESGRIPVARLTRILRQREGSTIVHAAHAVLNGELPEFRTPSGDGAYFVERDDPGAAQRAVVEMVATRLPKKFGFDPLRDVQVLTPMNKGPLGVFELNEQLKQALNPLGSGATRELFAGTSAGRERTRGTLSPGDRVIQTRNNYDLEVMNGEIGFAKSAGPKGELTVDFDDRVVVYPPKNVAELQPAFAITVHKSQGCEFEAVVLVLSMQHFVLLRRNLLYTAITRAKRVLILVGSPRALKTAIELGPVDRRRSLLEQRLRGELAA